MLTKRGQVHHRCSDGNAHRPEWGECHSSRLRPSQSVASDARPLARSRVAPRKSVRPGARCIPASTPRRTRRSGYRTVARRVPPNTLSGLPSLAACCDTLRIDYATSFFSLPETNLPGTREQLAKVHPTVVAITGSYGKTSTKGYVAHLVSATRTVVATPASFNNTAGLSRSVNEQRETGRLAKPEITFCPNDLNLANARVNPLIIALFGAGNGPPNKKPPP